jgi:hypothetical protein
MNKQNEPKTCLTKTAQQSFWYRVNLFSQITPFFQNKKPLPCLDRFTLIFLLNSQKEKIFLQNKPV